MYIKEKLLRFFCYLLTLIFIFSLLFSYIYILVLKNRVKVAIIKVPNCKYKTIAKIKNQYHFKFRVYNYKGELCKLQ